ncbi:MAG: flagellar basal body L-ring protein FlgH [Nitratireductor sp.]
MRYKSLFTIMLSLGLTGCGHTFHDYGKPPTLTPPQTQTLMEDVLITPEPEVVQATTRIEMSDNSIWNKKEGIYFKDTRAYEVGDILTVKISINESARIKSTADRQSTVDGSLNGALQGNIGTYEVPTVGVTGSGATDVSAARSGTVNRSEKIDLQIAAAVVAASSNGNLKVYGTQEVRVNSELRLMQVQGIVRSKDIAPDNSIPYEKIAEARISYGGHNTSQLKRKRFIPKIRLPKLLKAAK